MPGRALWPGAPVGGVNNRDLQPLETSLAPSLSLLPLIPPGSVAVSESGIMTGADVGRVVAAGAHAVLVGEGLVRATDIEAKVEGLLLMRPPPPLSPAAGEGEARRPVPPGPTGERDP